MYSIRWYSEEDGNDLKRKYPELIVLEKKWSNGNSPTILMRLGDVEQYMKEKNLSLEEYQATKCYWYSYPSIARCYGCKIQKTCVRYVGTREEGCVGRGPHLS